jgi:alpha-N-arabinofuranosidase
LTELKNIMQNRYRNIIVLFLLLLSKSAYQQSITNPILSGFYPDPSICKAGNDYYLITSSFAYYPGLPIFHSPDLLNWKQIGHVLDRPSQLNLEGAGVSRGLFAPAITYHKGVFYVVCTLVDKLGNFVVTTKDPRGPWSDPVALPEIDGIDPSIFFDDNDQAYIVYNSIPPDNISVHNGHRTIRINSFDHVNLKVTSDNKIIVNGGTDMALKPVWIEAPHIFRKDGWYYLICAEGGTAYQHSEVVFRSKEVYGPYISFKGNPILTQRHLDPARPDPVTTTGHADFTTDRQGNWWAVFLGCRPYEDDFYNTGRETFMAPVTWKDGWPLIDLGGDAVKYAYPIDAQRDPKIEKLNGNYHFTDSFHSATLNPRYIFLRTKTENWLHQQPNEGKLVVDLRPETISGTGNPSFVAFRQPHLQGYAVTQLHFTPKQENEQAGLVIFQNEHHYYFIAKSLVDGKEAVQLFKGPGIEHPKSPPVLLATRSLSGKAAAISFKIEAQNDRYHFYFSETGKDWISLAENIDGKFLSTKNAKGFVGAVYGMYATSNGKPGKGNQAAFSWFECKNEDRVYKMKK